MYHTKCITICLVQIRNSTSKQCHCSGSCCQCKCLGYLFISYCNELQSALLNGIGGTSVQECTNRILRHPVTDNIAKLYNWIGKGGKRAFSQFQLRHIIVGKQCCFWLK